MAAQFICIHCWKEFSSTAGDSARETVCPHCGYLQPVGLPTRKDGEAKTEPARTPRNLKETPIPAEPFSWDGLTDESDENTDQVPEEETEQEMGMDSPDADEKTPVVPTRPLVDEDGNEYTTIPGGAFRGADWMLRTPSGVVYRFSDPESLLGWKKKLGTYRTLEVSPDGAVWKDFALFVVAYEATGQAMQAFLEAGRNEPAGLSGLSGSGSLKDGALSRGTQEDHQGPFSETGQKVPRPTTDRMQSNPPTQFDFITLQPSRGTGWSTYLLFALLGLSIGAVLVILFWWSSS